MIIIHKNRWRVARRWSGGQEVGRLGGVEVVRIAPRSSGGREGERTAPRSSGGWEVERTARRSSKGREVERPLDLNASRSTTQGRSTWMRFARPPGAARPECDSLDLNAIRSTWMRFARPPEAARPKRDSIRSTSRGRSTSSIRSTSLRFIRLPCFPSRARSRGSNQPHSAQPLQYGHDPPPYRASGCQSFWQAQAQWPVSQPRCLPATETGVHPSNPQNHDGVKHLPFPSVKQQCNLSLRWDVFLIRETRLARTHLRLARPRVRSSSSPPRSTFGSLELVPPRPTSQPSRSVSEQGDQGLE